MKGVFIFALFVCGLANAQTNFFPLLSCSNRIYTNATIESVTPATVTIFWDGGGEKISITNLPPELLTRYHYDPQAAQEFLDQQAAKKMAQQQIANEQATALLAAQNSLGPAQKVRVVKPLVFPNSIQIEAEGGLSEAVIPNLPSGILAFLRELDQARADAANLKNQVAQAGNNTNQAAQGRRRGNRAPQPVSDDLKRRSADADKRLKDLESKASARTTVLAQPTGRMLTPKIRLWQFQAMASANSPTGTVANHSASGK